MLANIRIATRIAGGYALILLLLGGLAAFSYVASSRLGELADRFVEEFKTVVMASRTAIDAQRTMLGMERFLSSPTPEASADVQGLIAELQASAAGLYGRNLASVSDLRAAVDAFSSQAATVIEAATRRSALLDRVEAQGIAHRRDIGRLAQMLEDRGVHDLAFVGLTASDAFLTTRVRVDRFFAGQDVAEYDSAAAPLERTRSALQSLAAAPLTAEERAQLAAARDGVAAYSETIGEDRKSVV